MFQLGCGIESHFSASFSCARELQTCPLHCLVRSFLSHQHCQEDNQNQKPTSPSEQGSRASTPHGSLFLLSNHLNSCLLVLRKHHMVSELQSTHTYTAHAGCIYEDLDHTCSVISLDRVQGDSASFLLLVTEQQLSKRKVGIYLIN